MLITDNRTAVIIKALQEKHGLEYANSYGEPGYTDPEKNVLLANWNDIKRITQDYLSNAGFSLEWSDEWVIDYENNAKAYRTTPNSYGWQCKIMFTENGELLTPDCDVSEWVDECKMWDYKQSPKALPAWITEQQILDLGYIKFADDLETGLHPGQNDDPKTIAERITKQYSGCHVVFRIKEQSQFYTVLQAYFILD